MKRTCDSPITPTLLPLCFDGAAQRVFFYPRLFRKAADHFFALQQRAKGTDNPKPQVQSCVPTPFNACSPRNTPTLPTGHSPQAPPKYNQVRVA